MTMIDTKKLNKLWTRSTDLSNPLRERHMYDLAFFLWGNKHFDEAIAVSGALLDILAESPGASLWIDAMHLQSLVLHDSKRDQEAIEVELKALEYAETLEPASQRAFMHWNLADCYRTTQQPPLQETEYLKAIDAFIECDNKWYLGQAYIDLGNLHYDASRYEQSKHFLRLAVPVLEESQRLDLLPFVKYRLAGVERRLGNPQAALAHVHEALKLSKFAGDLLATRENKIELSIIHKEMGNYETALGFLQELIDDNDLPLKNRGAAKAIYYRAGILQELGKTAEAIEGFEESVPLLKIVDLEALAINAQLALIHLGTNKQVFNDKV